MELKRGIIFFAVLLLLFYLAYSLFFIDLKFSAKIVDIDVNPLEGDLEKGIIGVKPGERFTYSNVPVFVEVGRGDLSHEEAELADGILLSNLKQDLTIVGRPVSWSIDVIVPENWRAGTIKIILPENAGNARFEDKNGNQPVGVKISPEETNLLEDFFNINEKIEVSFEAFTGNYKLYFSTYPVKYSEKAIENGKVNVIENSGGFDYEDVFIVTSLDFGAFDDVKVLSETGEMLFAPDFYDSNNDGNIDSVRYEVSLTKFSRKTFYVLGLVAADVEGSNVEAKEVDDAILRELRQVRNVDAVALSPKTVSVSELPEGCGADSLFCSEFSACGFSSSDAFRGDVSRGRQSRICVATGVNCPVIIEDTRRCAVGGGREINLEAVAFAPGDIGEEVAQLAIFDEKTGAKVAELLLSTKNDKIQKVDIIFSQD